MSKNTYTLVPLKILLEFNNESIELTAEEVLTLYHKLSENIEWIRSVNRDYISDKKASKRLVND